MRIFTQRIIFSFYTTRRHSTKPVQQTVPLNVTKINYKTLIMIKTINIEF